MQHHLNT